MNDKIKRIAAHVGDANRAIQAANREFLAIPEADRARALATLLTLTGDLEPLPYSTQALLRVVSDPTQRAHEISKLFSPPLGINVPGMTPQQVAAHLLEHWTDPSIAYYAKVEEHTRAVRAHEEKLARAREIKAKREADELRRRDELHNEAVLRDNAARDAAANAENSARKAQEERELLALLETA